MSAANGAGPPRGRARVRDAVWAGLRDAVAPIARFLDMVGGHLILTGRALAWLPRRPFRAKNYLEAAE